MNASSTRAFVSALAVGAVVAISSFGVVRAEHAQPAKSKTFNCNAGFACLNGISSHNGTFGLYGASPGIAILGLTTNTSSAAAITGSSVGTSGNGVGVEGTSTNGQGVFGSATIGDGVEGYSGGLGASGVAALQFGQSGNSGPALYAESADNTMSYPVILGLGDSAGTDLLLLYNKTTGGGCSIDQSADLFCSGTTDVKSVRTRHLTNSGQHLLAYAAESSSATLEDFGSAHMIAGVAHVPMEHAFASTIDQSSPYLVFVTPGGDTRGLYVTAKTPAGFDVRESQGGRSTLSFDYRIVARPMDAKHDRLPLAPALSRPGKLRGGLLPAH